MDKIIGKCRIDGRWLMCIYICWAGWRMNYYTTSLYDYVKVAAENRALTHTHYHQCSLWMHRDSYAHNLGSIHPSTALKSACIHYSRLRRASKRFRSSFFILSLLCKKSWKEFDMFEYKNREKSARAHVQAFNTHDAKTRPTIIWRNTTFLSKKMCVNSKGLHGVYSSDA